MREFNSDYDIICIGMALVDSIIRGFDPKPVSASGFRAESCSLNVGGEAVNEAVALAKLGAKTGIICAIGEDAAGGMIEQALLRAGVDTKMAVRPADYGTPVTTMFVNADGTRKSVTNRSHTYNFRPDKHCGGIAGAGGVILGSLFRAPFDDPEILLSVVKKASAEGLIIFADTKLPNFRILSLKDIRESLSHIDYITPNEDEAAYFTGEKEPVKMAEVFLEHGVKNVIIKLGGKGCYFKNNDMEITLPAYDIDAKDATGAGDNFLAGFASEILAGQKIEKALTFANACGAICTTEVGAGTALKSRQQVEEFIKECGLHKII